MASWRNLLIAAFMLDAQMKVCCNNHPMGMVLSAYLAGDGLAGTNRFFVKLLQRAKLS